MKKIRFLIWANVITLYMALGLDFVTALVMIVALNLGYLYIERRFDENEF